METIINFNTVLEAMSDLWTPEIVAKSNRHEFKMVKFSGDFEWHVHDEDKVLLILEGDMRLEFRDPHDVVSLKAGDIYTVPKNSEHRPCSDTECGIILIEKT